MFISPQGSLGTLQRGQEGAGDFRNSQDHTHPESGTSKESLRTGSLNRVKIQREEGIEDACGPWLLPESSSNNALSENERGQRPLEPGRVLRVPGE